MDFNNPEYDLSINVCLMSRKLSYLKLIALHYTPRYALTLQLRTHLLIAFSQ